MIKKGHTEVECFIYLPLVGFKTTHFLHSVLRGPYKDPVEELSPKTAFTDKQ